MSYCDKSAIIPYCANKNCEKCHPDEKCEHKNRQSLSGLLEDYDKCVDCGLEIPHNFPYQWNF